MWLIGRRTFSFVTHRQYNYALRAAGQGFLIGIASGLAGGYLLQRRYAHIRNLTLTMKTFLVAYCGTGVGVIFADHAGIRFDVRLSCSPQANALQGQSSVGRTRGKISVGTEMGESFYFR